ncbi:MAG: Hsp70 family protein [Kofleriaceae bacterium]|nr:Hsp70 family protein [Kofleriaceae bacterium]
MALSMTGPDPKKAKPAPRDAGEPGSQGASATPIVGIDLGTTYTSIGVVVGNKVQVLARDTGARFTPSVIAIPKKGEVIVGEAARARIATDPARTITSPKRLLGRPYTDREVQTFVGQQPYRTKAGPDGTTVVEMWGDDYAITQLSSYLMRDVRELAEQRLGQPVREAVIAVPVAFDVQRMQAVRRAAQMAGLEVASLIDEPSAAALANRYTPGFGGVVGVYDFGGGTFDFSLVDVSKAQFRILATAGDNWLGGDDLDNVLAEAAANQFWRLHKVDLRRQAVEWQRLRFACEAAKRSLTNAESALIAVPEVLRTATGMIGLELGIDRATLARAAASLIQRTLQVCEHALARAGLRPKDMSAVYMVGGTSRMPAVTEAVARYFGVPVRTGVAPDQAVCLGAAIHASLLAARRARAAAV